MDAVDCERVSAGVTAKQRNIGGNHTAAGAGVTATVAAGEFLIIPPENQRGAVERGDMSALPRESDRASTQDPRSGPKTVSGEASCLSKIGAIAPSSVRKPDIAAQDVKLTQESRATSGNSGERQQ